MPQLCALILTKTNFRSAGSFEKRDEKSSTTEAPGSKVDALLNTVLAASSNGICARKCIGTRSNSSPISSALRSSNLDGGINKTSRKLSASGNSSAIRTDYKECEMERRGDISNADATSIASLWIDSAKSPSPPPPSASICVTASRIERTALSSSGRSGPESIFSQSDSIFKNAEESGTNSFLDTSSEQASGINCDYKKSCSTISFAASTLMGPDTVLFGQILSGVLTQGDRLVLGPIGIEGTFSSCSIQSIRVNDVPVRSAVAGQTATMVLNQEHEDLTCQPPSDTVVESTPGDLADQRLVNSSSVSLDSICSGVTSNAAATVDSGDNIRCRDNSSRSKSLSSQVTSVSAGSGLVLLSPAFNPVAYWEFEVRLRQLLTIVILAIV